MTLRRSLIGRLLLLAGAVAVVSIAATTWLVMTSTTAAIRQQQGQSLSDDALIYRQLITYAAGHRSWSGVQPTLVALARRTGRTITLTTRERRTLASSSPRASLAGSTTAVLDALDVDAALDPSAAQNSIAKGVTGPYRTTTRAAIPAPAPVAGSTGPVEDRRALSHLLTLVNRCLPHGRHIALTRLALANGVPAPRLASASPVLARCYARARTAQLRPYVAPVASLYVGGAGGTAASALDLSGPHRRRILEVALLILLVTIGVTALAARRLTRPLRALTTAAEDMTDGAVDTRVRIAGRDEVARLGRAFNAMASRRAALEAQRTALVNDVAHELRTPVSNIRGWLEAAEDGLAPMDRAFAASLLEEADQLTHLIEDLTDLAAAEAGELRLHPEPVDLADIVAHVAAAHRIAAEHAAVTIRTAVSGELDGDPVRLRQLLGNLLSNAIRHSPSGGVVTIRSRREVGTIVIEVADHGPGIAAEDLNRVFDRFWRAEKSRARSTGGSGLGLPIVRRLAEAHGGSVSVTSRPGHGATFAVALPARAGSSPGPVRLPADQPAAPPASVR